MAEEAGYLMQYRFMRAGVSEEDAATLSECLVSTCLNGIDSHGVRLFTFYLSELENGRATPRPDMVFEQNMGISSVLDADNASGILAGMSAKQKCIGLCISNSDALVSLHGGVDPFLGTNPISFSVPCGKGKRFELDFATSQMALALYSLIVAVSSFQLVNLFVSHLIHQLT
jgi:ureidoglycolate dehydrogenase (NAD+)